MVLTHAVEISVAHAASQGSNMAAPKDLALTVKSFSTQTERQALLDAADIAGLNVLQLVDENTAAALQYAMDKKFDDGEQLILFYNLGASALQVSLVRFYSYDAPQKFGKPKPSPALEVLAKTYDATLGGEALDSVLVEYLADQFNHIWKKGDVRTVPRAMTKLRIQANKIKHVLSANMEIPVHMDSLHDDISLSTHVTREQLETLAAPVLARATQPLLDCLAAANKTVSDLTAVELIGGGMRVPRVQSDISKALGVDQNETLKDLVGLHMNADESMALGASFVAANLSTAFRVRHIGVTDIYPWEVAVALSDDGDEAWSKEATIFKEGSKMGIKKTIAFTHDKDVHCELDYADAESLPAGTEAALGRYDVSGVADFAKEMEEKGLGKPKVSLQFELSNSGIVGLVKAEAAVEETYTVEEEVEVEEEDAETKDAKEKSDTNETDGTEESTKKAKKTVTVEKVGFEFGCGLLAPRTRPDSHTQLAFLSKEKKRQIKKALSVKASFVTRVQPYSDELMIESKEKLSAMAEKDRERVLLEEAKNKVESYIYFVKNKLEDDADAIGKVSNKKQREEAKKLAEAAEEWLYEDGYNADLKTMQSKYLELSEPFDKILLRLSETTARPEAITAMSKKLDEVEALMKKWEESKPQITEEERKDVLDQVEEVRKWIAEKEGKQAKKKAHEEPAFLSEEVPLQTKKLEAMVLRLSKKPKPKPVKTEETPSNETANATEPEGEESVEDADNSTEANETVEEEDEL